MIDSAWFWLILGALLILSEFFLTGIVAVFFGVGALLVGVLVAAGLLPGLASQVLVFSVLSVGSLLFARDRIRVWFRGRVSDRWQGDQDLIASRGARAEVTRPFDNGVGRVRLSGSEWKAECEGGRFEPGDTVWVTGHRGITLLVSDRRPDEASEA